MNVINKARNRNYRTKLFSQGVRARNVIRSATNHDCNRTYGVFILFFFFVFTLPTHTRG